MVRYIVLVFLVLAFAGCQPAAEKTNTASIQAQRQEAAKKLFAQGMMLLHQQDLKGAVENIGASIKADPTDPNPYLVLGQILIKAQQYEQAVSFLDQTAKNFPNNGTVFYMLSIANKMSNKPLPAVLAARRSFEIFNAAGDAENAKSSAILVEELIKAAQEEQNSKEEPTSKSKDK